MRGFNTWIRAQMASGGYESVDTMFTASSVLSMLINLVAAGLLIAGLAVAARALSPGRAS